MSLGIINIHLVWTSFGLSVYRGFNPPYISQNHKK